MGAQGVSKGRVFKIAWTLLTLRRHLACNFREADRAIIEELMDWLNGTKFSANTKSDHKKILKKFYKYVRNGSTAARLRYQTGEHPDCGRLASAVRSKEAEDLAIVHAKAKVIHCRHIVKLPGEVLCLNQAASPFHLVPHG